MTRKGRLRGKEGAFRDICGKPLSSASLYVLGWWVSGRRRIASSASSSISRRQQSSYRVGNAGDRGHTHPQVSLGTQRILLMAAGTEGEAVGVATARATPQQQKTGAGGRQEEGEADHQLLQVPHRSGGRGAAAAQGHSSGNQGASLGTQQQVSGLRPPSLDEKQSGGHNRMSTKARGSSNPSGTTAAYRLRGSRSNALVISRSK
ncbi:hypothetical protein TcYC6_0003800 [Trypanosoma cruzi]|nr:hypothetical protein TcYC6_0003800 [Trypanosoma cruzi]